MDRTTRIPLFFSYPFSLVSLLFGLALTSACEEGPSWPRVAQASQDAGCQGPKAPSSTSSAPLSSAGSSSSPADSSGGPTPEPSATSSAGQQSSSSSLTPTQDDAGSTSPPSMSVTLWELLYDPERVDGLAESPEVVDLLVQGPPGHRGPLDFELVGQGWSSLTPEKLSDSGELVMPVGSILRIERYKNQSELDKAQRLFPKLQVLDPSTGKLAVQILRQSGAGLRNKGGWLALRGDPQGALEGVIYGDIEPEKIDPALLAQWKGPFANPAPSGKALCQIPEKTDTTQSDAAWWTACEASIWGREYGRKK